VRSHRPRPELCLPSLSATTFLFHCWRCAMFRHIQSAGCLLLIVFLLCAGLSQAQSTTGRIVGTVSDASGAVLPGVEIVVRNPDTGFVRTVVTEESGNYNVPLLQPGTYEVQASLTGFRREVRSGITVQVESVIRIDFRLNVGDIT